MSDKFKVLLVHPTSPLLNPPPIGVGLLIALLRQEGFEVHLFDNGLYKVPDHLHGGKVKESRLQVTPFDYGTRDLILKESDPIADFVTKVTTVQPSLIAFSTLESVYELTISMIDALDNGSDLDKIPILVGGVFPTWAPDLVINHPKVDMICKGEGEGAIVDLCKAMDAGIDYSEIPNLWVKNDFGSIVKSKIQRPLVDVNKIPIPDFSLFEEGRFLRPMGGEVYVTIPIETSRGCPYKCNYCNSPANTRMYEEESESGNSFLRKKTVNTVYKELKYLINKFNGEYVYFCSDTFFVWSAAEIDEFTEMYSEFKLPFWIQTHPNTIKDSYIRKMKSVGLNR